MIAFEFTGVIGDYQFPVRLEMAAGGGGKSYFLFIADRYCGEIVRYINGCKCFFKRPENFTLDDEQILAQLCDSHFDTHEVNGSVPTF